MQQPLFAAFHALLHFAGASGSAVGLQCSHGHRGARKIAVLQRGARISGKMPSAVAALRRSQVRRKKIRNAIRGIAGAHQRFDGVQIVVRAA